MPAISMHGAPPWAGNSLCSRSRAPSLSQSSVGKARAVRCNDLAGRAPELCALHPRRRSSARRRGRSAARVGARCCAEYGFIGGGGNRACRTFRLQMALRALRPDRDTARAARRRRRRSGAAHRVHRAHGGRLDAHVPGTGGRDVAPGRAPDDHRLSSPGTNIMSAALLSLLFVAGTMLQAGRPAQAEAAIAPDALMKSVTAEVIAVLQESRGASQPTKVADLVEAKVLPLFDFARMTSIAMALNWRNASPAQQKALTAEFK